MDDTQIKQAIRMGVPFFAITSHGDVLARYLPLAPVFQWKKNQMVAAPLQGDDLAWWLQSSAEEGRDATDDGK